MGKKRSNRSTSSTSSRGSGNSVGGSGNSNNTAASSSVNMSSNHNMGGGNNAPNNPHGNGTNSSYHGMPMPMNLPPSVTMNVNGTPVAVPMMSNHANPQTQPHHSQQQQQHPTHPHQSNPNQQNQQSQPNPYPSTPGQFTPAMIRELLSASTTNSGNWLNTSSGYYRTGSELSMATTSENLNRLTNMANASAAATSNVGAPGTGTTSNPVAGGGANTGTGTNNVRNANNNGNGNITAQMGNMSQEDAMAAQRYLQSISQALASQLSASGGVNGNNPNASNNNAGNIANKVFGPMPPPPTGKGGVSVTMGSGPVMSGVGGMSATISGVNGSSASFDLDASCSSVQSLGFQLEALSALMAQQQGQGGSSGSINISGTMSGKPRSSNNNNSNNNSSDNNNNNNVQAATTAQALDALEKMGQATVDHMSNFQQLLNVIAAQAASGGATTGSVSGSFTVGKNSANSARNSGNNTSNSGHSGGSNQNNSEDLNNLLPIFTELVSLTNTIVTAQENGDAAKVDAATSQLCDRVMKDNRAMSVLGVAMNEMNNGMGAANPGNDGQVVTGNNTNMPLNPMAISQGLATSGLNCLFQASQVPQNEKNMSKEEMEKHLANMQAAQNEALRKVAALSASMQAQSAQLNQAQNYQQQGNQGGNHQQGQGQQQGGQGAQQGQQKGGKKGTPVFSMIFGGGNSNNANNQNTAANNANMPPNLPQGVAVPPLPPPPGGWPPNAAPAAAAAAAMAAFASMGDGTGAPPFPNANMGGGVPGINPPSGDGSSQVDSAAWLDYYDACLRARGVKGGIAEFEEFARLSQQGAAMTAQMNAAGMTGGNMVGRSHHHSGMPQDCLIPRGGKEDEHLPAGFEYDDGQRPVGQLSEEQLAAIQEEEEEKREKKAAKKRDKKARQKERAKMEAEAKAAAAATKKREKAITSWRSRVVSAVSNGDARKMDVLVGESPYKNYTYDPTAFEDDDNDGDYDDDNDDEDRPKNHEEYLSQHMHWFLHSCLQKYQNSTETDSLFGISDVTGQQVQPFADNSARERLVMYLLSLSFDVVLLQFPDVNLKRNAIHTAAYNNDANFIQWIIESQNQQKSKSNQNQYEKMDYLECLCEDGGWTPLHYATAGGAENVVELLMVEGVNVTMRTERSLTAFNRRRGNGVTPRELAIVLQAGAVDDDLTSNADILDDIVENRIENVSSADKAAYMRILNILEQRLDEVEDHGYSPPVKKNPLLESRSEVPFQDRPMLLQPNRGSSGGDGGSVAASATSSNTNTKRTKKKKKKQQQLEKAKANAHTATTATSSQPESKACAPIEVTADDDMSDPVAVALLGMGFTEDQIKSAARALGGFDRATADDMVMWILGGGEITDTGPDADQGNYAEEEHNDDGEVLTKAQKKAAAKVKREAEEAARKFQEEQAAVQRAAAKREEQRRIRREWNEREQARQLQEKEGKIAEAMERRRLKEMEKLLPKNPVLPAAPPGATLPPAAVHVQGGGGRGGKQHHLPGGPPMTIIAGGPKMPGSGKSKKQQADMGIPQGPTVRAPKILARPSNAPPGTLPGGERGVRHPHAPQSAMPGVGSQPLFAPAHPGSSSGGKPALSPPRSIHAKPSYHQSASHHQQHQPIAILQKNIAGPRNMQSARGHHHAPVASADYHHHAGHHAPPNYASYKDHSTRQANGAQPSMGGSTPLYEHQHSQGTAGSNVGPPGFQSGNSALQPPSESTSAASSYVEANPMGMIRASAREFVPTSFTPAESHAVPSMSAQSMSAQPETMSADQPAMVSPPPPTRTASHDHSANLLVEPMSSLLSSFGADSNTPPATMVPNKEDTVPSAASSITGLSGLPATTAEDNNPTSRVGSVMTFESTSSALGGAGGGIQTSSILESISYGAGVGDQAAIENIATGAVPTLGSGGIGLWGGSNNVNQTASLGLAGLNFSSFMGGTTTTGDQTNNNHEGGGTSSNLAGGSTTWGTSMGGSGSIW